MIPPIVDRVWVEAHPGAVLADVRWYPDGADPEAAYASGHLPGAVRVDLERVLAGPASEEGRHPLPEPADFAAGLSAAGIGDGSTVVAYDDAGGVIAARLVWMLRSLGRDASLLDGGIGAWSGPLATGPAAEGSSEATAGAARRRRRQERGDWPAPPPPAPFTPQPWPPELLAGVDEVEAVAEGRDPATVLLDARPAERYAGAPDALDPRAGHIPGARSLPCREHLGHDGRLLAVSELRARLAGAGVAAETRVISSCGSGVTACHTLLVMEHAGFGGGRLYPGSWSEWSRSDRPAATGPEPRPVDAGRPPDRP